ncbi:DUF1345 domain-containing protein [Microlunatus flavus]|uniref:Uncharacterized membrane protein n=1 Tax=Microlunatus flavus TaxID=1036181 RepID=A0A1H9L566_9ACTN|nr:DUF1345 domain-containing protein [Microlunatus flavus]SER06478.1 Uncharacterized membrane protein [Microlunatus flavus]
MSGRILSARRALVCVAVGTVVGLVAGLVADARLGPLAGWCAAGTLALVWVWRLCWPMDRDGTERVAREESSSRVTDDAVVVACLASVVAVVVALTQSSSQDPDAASVALIILGVLATMVAWALVNTVYALKYARLYFVDQSEDGLDFQQATSPRYSDFAFLAFTVGMSFAVADIEPTSSDMRRSALPHALLSYFFGTVLIAVAINLVTNLAQG